MEWMEYEMKKRLIGALIALSMLISVVVVSSAAELKSFQDMDNSEWYAVYVYALYQKDVVSGTSNTSFGPKSLCQGLG